MSDKLPPSTTELFANARNAFDRTHRAHALWRGLITSTYRGDAGPVIKAIDETVEALQAVRTAIVEFVKP